MNIDLWYIIPALLTGFYYFIKDYKELPRPNEPSRAMYTIPWGNGISDIIAQQEANFLALPFELWDVKTQRQEGGYNKVTARRGANPSDSSPPAGET